MAYRRARRGLPGASRAVESPWTDGPAPVDTSHHARVAYRCVGVRRSHGAIVPRAARPARRRQPSVQAVLAPRARRALRICRCKRAKEKRLRRNVTTQLVLHKHHTTMSTDTQSMQLALTKPRGVGVCSWRASATTTHTQHTHAQIQFFAIAICKRIGKLTEEATQSVQDSTSPEDTGTCIQAGSHNHGSAKACLS